MPSTRARLAVLAAAVAILWGTPVLEKETVCVRVKLIQGEVPTDPLAPIWNTIAATEFPTSPQVHWPKRILQVTVKSVKVRVFFFSSRRRHTRLQGDWSSDVCSSD